MKAYNNHVLKSCDKHWHENEKMETNEMIKSAYLKGVVITNITINIVHISCMNQK
jgi:hypothetical protein